MKGGESMIKADLVDKVAEKSGLTKKDSSKAVDAVFAAITEALSSGDKVQLVGFGTFETRKREARKGINPRTREELDIPAKIVPVFRPGRALRDSVE